MGNSTVVRELERALKAVDAPKRIQVFFYESRSILEQRSGRCLYIDCPAWQDDGHGGGAITGAGPMAYDPYEIAGWRAVEAGE